MILFVLAPKIIIISGPKATLGRELSIVKKGSTILAKVLHSYKIRAIINPLDIPRIKEINTSIKVV